MKLFSSRRRVAAVAALIVLMLFLLRPGASRLKSRIISSISASLGRSVDLSSVHIRLLPRPGFDLENLVVYDDPAFGAEPMLRASEVTADLRLMSLLRGRIEIARLDLTEPSLNLVHASTGRWNLETLLERSAHMPMAPTGKAKSAPQPRFPYIEGSSGRINFKSGPEKKPYALISADFSLWQESENEWGVRLKAQPFRTDLNLNDIGQLQLNGIWQRAANVKETPLKFDVEWTRAQLGQVTKFLTGSDQGWRGDIQVDTTLSGTLAELKIAGTTSVDDFRRYDITSGKALRLTVHCDGEYSSLSHEFHQVLCGAPTGNGLVTLAGDVGLPGSRRYSITVKAENVPAASLVMLVQRAKRNLPDDVAADGTLEGTLTMQQDARAGGKPRFDGHGEITDFHLSSARMKAELGPTTVPFVLIRGSGKHDQGATNRRGFTVPAGAHLEIGPVALSSGHGAASTRGWMNRSSYDFTIVGESEITKMLRLGRVLGVPTISAIAEGTAQLNLQIAGSWSGAAAVSKDAFPPSQVTGTAKLKNVRITAVNLSDPLEISSAEMQLGEDAVRVSRLSATAAGTTWKGSLEMPRGCGTPAQCPVKFALNANEIALSRVNEWATGNGKQRPWYRVLQSDKAGSSLLARLHASGHVTANRFVIHGVTASVVSADIDLDAGKMRVSNLEGDLFGGKHRGKWQADFTASPWICKGVGTLSGVSLDEIATQMGDDWIAGTASGSYNITGPCTPKFWQSAEGVLQADVRNGALPHVLLDQDSELQIMRLTGEARLADGKLVLRSATLDSPIGNYAISGTASLQRDLDLKMTRTQAEAARSGYEITGTIAKPQVSPLSKTEQARLKTSAAQ
ncbi:MAG TPA: AsmA family protein [Candidatus Sulfotelmatobacter sp.]|nr:AsmA family protein [Candidatus Sulfotelmatobacter sp.]